MKTTLCNRATSTNSHLIRLSLVLIFIRSPCPPFCAPWAASSARALRVKASVSSPFGLLSALKERDVRDILSYSLLVIGLAVDDTPRQNVEVDRVHVSGLH